MVGQANNAEQIFSIQWLSNKVETITQMWKPFLKIQKGMLLTEYSKT